MRSLLGGIKRQAMEHRKWLSESGGAWDGISAACGQEKIKTLAARLNMDAVASSPKGHHLDRPFDCCHVRQ